MPRPTLHRFAAFLLLISSGAAAFGRAVCHAEQSVHSNTPAKPKVAPMLVTDRALERTGLQEAGRYDPRYDLRTDFVMAYGAGSQMAEKLKRWGEAGYVLQIMTGVAWGSCQDYLDGKHRRGRGARKHGQGGALRERVLAQHAGSKTRLASVRGRTMAVHVRSTHPTSWCAIRAKSASIDRMATRPSTPSGTTGSFIATISMGRSGETFLRSSAVGGRVR